MKMREVIERVSELYRHNRGERSKIHDELLEVYDALNTAERDGCRNISHAEYEALNTKKNYLKLQLDYIEQYCEGISAARELLMDLGFETDATN